MIITAKEELEILFQLNNESDNYEDYAKNRITKMLNAWHKRNPKGDVFSQIPTKMYHSLTYPANIWVFELLNKKPQDFKGVNPNIVFNIFDEDYYNLNYNGIEHIIYQNILSNFKNKNKAKNIIEALSFNTKFFENIAKDSQKTQQFLTWAEQNLTQDQYNDLAVAIPSVLAKKMNIKGYVGQLIKLDEAIAGNAPKKIISVINQINPSDIKAHETWEDLREHLSENFDQFKVVVQACTALGWSEKNLKMITPSIDTIDLREEEGFLKYFFENKPTYFHKGLREYFGPPCDVDDLKAIGDFCITLKKHGVDVEKIDHVIETDRLGWQLQSFYEDNTHNETSWIKALKKYKPVLPSRLNNTIDLITSVIENSALPTGDIYKVNKKSLMNRNTDYDEYDDIVYNIQDALVSAAERGAILKKVGAATQTGTPKKRKM